jgi:hypothetical protein
MINGTGRQQRNTLQCLVDDDGSADVGADATVR